jgi:putative ABC transport system substrate-binding protein
VTISIAATIALQGETRTIPIVFVGVADPVASGIVPRLNQPGGNITGFATVETTLGGKWLADPAPSPRWGGLNKKTWLMAGEHSL